MPTAYSLDLRERVRRACEQEQGTRGEIAERFEVSVSFVRDVRRRVRESGSAAAKPHGGGRRAKPTPGRINSSSGWSRRAVTTRWPNTLKAWQCCPVERV